MQEKQILSRINKTEQRIVDLYNRLKGSNTPVTPVTPSDYKVYTALLTQSGPSNPATTFDGGDPIIIGQTYEIVNNGGNGWDFTNIGAPNNNIGTKFVATGTTPANWGVNAELDWNTATPVVRVLDNTVGDIWFEYSGAGLYRVKSNGLFISNKTVIFITSQPVGAGFGVVSGAFLSSGSTIILATQSASGPIDGNLNKSTFEIRVYN